MLRKNIGQFPKAERDQNAKWYSLYRQVQLEPAVAEAHKNYLLFRDMAAMSILLLPTVPVLLYFAGVDAVRVGASATVLLCQYFLTSLAARTNGIRFVQNVLAVHASRELTE
jgi:hypothetical protein